MKILLRIIALLCLAPLVFGQAEKTFTMQAPTARENGDALALNEIGSYTLTCGLLPGGPYDVVSVNQSATQQSTETIASGTIFDAGDYFCIATDTDTGGLESRGSNEINFTVGRCDVSDCRPGPPTLSIASP